MKRNLTSFLFLIILISFGCSQNTQNFPENGVSKKLADERKTNISELSYTIHFDIPEKIERPITGNVDVKFKLKDKTKPVVFDFNEDPSNVLEVKVNDKKVNYLFRNEHIIINKENLIQGFNSIQITFKAGETSLNRNEEYLYTLFVPDRASFAFPCFDQPDLKAKYNLSLSVPEDWKAVGNGETIDELVKDNKRFYRFAETKPISTYLFSFAAGKFEVIEKEIFGYKMKMFHREFDKKKLENNADIILNLHAKALKWLEEYTDFKYPFGKFDFVVIPTFQYSGMEHPGAILYRSSKLFLDENPSETQLLKRASLISHETAHMWFGDLVTMDWFDDVWLKEVFANFMAAKIANPTFPKVNHKLRYTMAHFPGAYSIDRTSGANPIKQKLENLKFAGTLYGAIIYQKSPIVMQQLENIIGKEKLQDGIKEYLTKFQFANADWTDLISILDSKTEEEIGRAHV